MNVELLTSRQSLIDMEGFAVRAAQTCYGNEGKAVNYQEFLQRIINRKHESILEHIYLTYRIQGLSRACLQQLARHRHITLSVESTRHTLRKQIDTMPISAENGYYSYLEKFNQAFREFADEHPDMPNDELKYYLPEFWPVKLFMTANVRALRWILNLRTAPQALKEFRTLARKLFEAVPDEFKYLLADCVHEEAKL
ncbi:MAG: FAD-dependent thymidylate synthase [Synergistaceae bacterium]|nr:FAD-dependent thymidylate synthase [Synergistaceae bacterium]